MSGKEIRELLARAQLSQVRAKDGYWGDLHTILGHAPNEHLRVSQARLSNACNDKEPKWLPNEFIVWLRHKADEADTRILLARTCPDCGGSCDDRRVAHRCYGNGGHALILAPGEAVKTPPKRRDKRRKVRHAVSVTEAAWREAEATRKRLGVTWDELVEAGAEALQKGDWWRP
jgi:hypothetical protein